MKEIHRSTFREIKSSFGRFMAIFSIIALGVGFFAGLKVARGAIVTAVEGYLDDHAFYDFRLISTLGFEENDTALLLEQEDVEAAEGAVSLDMLYQLEDGSQGVVKVHSLTETVNTVELTAGRMPQADNECLADNSMFGEDALGSVIFLSQDNEEDTLECFKYDAYTVVGLVQSPLYIQFERGNTSLGSGRVSGFLYLPREGLDMDYDTEIYVRFDQDNPLYGEGYETYIGEKEGVWEELAARTADRRYQSILAEAMGELEDARQEFEDKKAEGEEELADAAETLEDARQQLADGEQALTDAREELADAENTLEEKERELEEGRQTLAEKEQELADAEARLADGEAQWKDSEQEVNSGWSQLNNQKEQLQQQKTELEEQAAKVEKNAADLEEQSALLEEKSALLEEKSAQLEAAAAMGLVSAEELEAGRREIEAGRQEIEAGRQQITAGRQEIEGYRQQIEAGRQQISGYESQIAGAETQLWQATTQLSEGKKELEEAAKEIADGKQAIADARQELTDGEQAIADARQEISEAKETLAEKEAELADAKQEVADGEQEYADALKEFDEKIADGEAELADAEAEVADLEAPDTYVLGRDTNVGYVCFESDSGIVDGIANIFPIFFFLVAALVCITTMNRMVEEQRTQIGVLKALGYGNGTIMSKYMIYSGLAALLGCVTGFFLGTWGFPKVIWMGYGIMYQAGPVGYVFHWKLGAISLAVSLLCSVGTTWLSCRMDLARNAAQLMRPKAPKAGKRVFLERIPFLWKRLGFLRKVSLRNIFRYKKRFLMMVVGISGCTALLVTGFGINDSIADIAVRQFEKIQTYDLAVSFSEPADEKQQEELSGLGLEDYLCVMEKSMDIVTEQGVKSIYLVAADPEALPEFVNLHTKSGDAIPYPGSGQAVLTRKLAEQYGVETGDTVTLQDENMQRITVTVSAVMENYIYNYVYISEETWLQAMGEAPEKKTAYVNLTPEDDPYQVSAELMKLDSVSSVTVNRDFMSRINSMMESLNLIVLVVIICAAGLAFIVLYNLTNINITERVREIATVKVLGFYKKETASYVFRENMLLTVLGMALGLFLGRFLHAFVINEIQVDMVAFDTIVKPVSYLYSALLTLIFAWAVNRVMGPKLENISMTESLKSVD